MLFTYIATAFGNLLHRLSCSFSYFIFYTVYVICSETILSLRSKIYVIHLCIVFFSTLKFIFLE